MKTKTMICATLLASLTLTGCKEDKNYVLEIKPIELDSYEITTSSEGGRYQIQVLAQEDVAFCNKYIYYSSEQVDSYDANNIDARWYQVHLDGKTVTVEVSTNTSTEERMGGFIVCSTKTHDSSQVYIKQTGNQR